MPHGSVGVAQGDFQNRLVYRIEHIIGNNLGITVIPLDLTLHGGVVVFRVINVVETAQHRNGGGQLMTGIQRLADDFLWQAVQHGRLMRIHDARPVVADENDLFGEFPKQIGQHHMRSAACHGKCNITAI